MATGATINFGTGNRTNLSVTASVSGDPATGAVTVSASYSIWTKYSIDDSQTLNGAGLFGGWTHNFQNKTSGGTVGIVTWNGSVSTVYGSTQSVHLGGWITGHWANINPSVDEWVTIPARPYLPPRQPPSASVARVSDTQHTVSWTASYDSASGAQPWTGVYVERWDNVSNAWYQIATVGWDVTSYSDTSTRADRIYQYRVRAYNPAGTSAYTTTSTIRTTPAAPSNVSAVKSGADIVVSWTDNATAETSFDVYDDAAGTGSWVKTGLGANVTTWTHPAPDPAKTHRYKVRAVNSTGSAESAFSATVQLQAPPNAPTGLTAPAVFDATTAQTFSWSHNPVDTSAQTAYEIQYRLKGAGTWSTTGKIASGTSSRSFAANFFANGKEYEWQVRTWGAHATASAWSATATFVTSAKPTATIQAPGATVNGSVVTVSWTYFDAESTAQAASKVTLTSGGETLYSETIVGANTSRAIPVDLKDGVSYTVTVEVQDGSGLWSSVASRAFTVDFAEPHKPEVSGVWDRETGSVVLTITNPPFEEGEAEAVSNTVWRSINGVWEVVASNVPPNTAITDRVPALRANNTYRVTAVSAIPSSKDSDPLVITTDDARGRIFINGGPGYATTVRLRDNAALNISFERATAFNRYAGRPFSVATEGEALTHTIGVSARLGPDTSTLAEIQGLVRDGGPMIYRDPDGRRFRAKVTGLSSGRSGVKTTVSFTVTEVDPT